MRPSLVACCGCTECSLDRLWGPPQLIVDKRVRASPGLVVRRARAPLLAHLRICGECSRGPSGSNLTLPPRCLPGCAAAPGRRFPGPVGEAAAAAGCPERLGQLAASKAGLSHPFSRRALPGFAGSLRRSRERSKSNISAAYFCRNQEDMLF